MKDIEELIKEIVKQSKDKDAHYYYGCEYSNDYEKPLYKVYIGFSKQGVEPVMVSGDSKANIKRTLKDYLNNNDVKEVTLRYYKSEISTHEKAIRFLNSKIKEHQDS